MNARPSSLQNQQLLPALTFRDDELEDPKKSAKIIRDIYSTVGVAFERAMRLVDTDPRMNDTRIAHGLAVMQGTVLLDRATLPNDGDLFFAIDGGRRGVFGTGSGGAPTGGGTAPVVGAPHDILSAEHLDSLAAAVSRGSLIYGNATPKWAELVAPGSASVLKNDATDAAWVAIPTRKAWLPHSHWVISQTNPPTDATHGTYPNEYAAWDFSSAGTEGILANFEVPEDWLSGVLTFKVRWATAGATATNWVPFIRYLEINDGGTLTAANTLITGPTTSANVAVDVLTTTTIGTYTPAGANRFVRLVFERAPGGADTYLGTIRVVGIRVEYTPLY